MRGVAPWLGSSNCTCTGRSNHSAANASIWWEKFFRTQSSLKRLGAATRSTACVSSYASGTSGRIHALICWGEFLLKTTDAGLPEFFHVALIQTSILPCMGMGYPQGGTGLALGPALNCLTRQGKLAEMVGFSEFCLSEGFAEGLEHEPC